MDIARIQNKYRGSLLGSLMGDCLGSPFEGDTISSDKVSYIKNYFDTLEEAQQIDSIKKYTDDTAMMISVATTLIERLEVDTKYLAELFVKEYYEEPDRGYGQNVVEVFHKLQNRNFDNLFKPAEEQFNGSGSYGNGGAMRVTPIGLFYHNNYYAMIEAAKLSTKITHTNPLGLNGAILQCIAIAEAFHYDYPQQKIDPQQFCKTIMEKIKQIEKQNENIDEKFFYYKKIKIINDLLQRQGSQDLHDEIISKLGNSISAYKSVPTAIYCFLRALKESDGNDILRNTIQYAISLGGDTDTIACMAGAISGAYLGQEFINKNLLKHCECFEDILIMSDDLLVAFQTVNK